MDEISDATKLMRMIMIHECIEFGPLTDSFIKV